MKNKEYIDLGLKYGGYMAQDRAFLENRLANLDDEKEKMLLVTPPSSVINAYFAESMLILQSFIKNVLHKMLQTISLSCHVIWRCFKTSQIFILKEKKAQKISALCA